MSLARIAHAAVVLAAVGLVGAAAPAPASQPAGHASYVAPVPHKYGANHLRQGLHCETREIS
ncbi:MAG: hypothetical protein ACR2K3_09035 [Nocardioides sp.]